METLHCTSLKTAADPRDTLCTHSLFLFLIYKSNIKRQTRKAIALSGIPREKSEVEDNLLP